MITASNPRMASATSGWMAGGGSSQRRATPRPSLCAASTSTSPRVTEPSAYSAQIVALSTLTGHTRPSQPSSVRSASMATRKSPLYCSIIESSRLPPVCPDSFACSRSIGSRDSRTRRASPSFFESASAHFRTSPGGSTPSSSRSWPELPPLSNMVTTA